MFGLFGKKKKTTIYDEIRDLIAYQKVSKLIEKANNLLKLGRRDEAVDIFSEAEQISINAVQNAPDSFQANLLLAFFYKEAHVYDRAEEILDKLLSSDKFRLDEEKRIIIGGELQQLRREKPVSEKNKGDSSDDFTKIYSCQNCGRIINFVTMPCPHCQWYPSDISSLARSIALSNPTIKVPALLLLAREVANGRSPSDVVVNLESNAKEYYEMPESDSRLKYMFDLLQKNANKNARDMSMVRECPNCGERIVLSHEEECGSCGEPIGWPESIKLLVCMDNLMWLFEQRVEGDNSNEFSEFVCLLAAMTNELLRKQEAPSINQRKYALSLLREMKAISDSNKGAVIDTTSPDKLQIYLVKDNMLDDSEQFGLFLYSEVEYFASKMINGISL